MSSGVYSNGIREVMRGNIDLINAVVSVALIDTSLYTVDLANDDSLADVAAAAIIAEATLTNKTLDGTVFRADELTVPSVTGEDVGAVAVFLDTDTDAGSILIAYIDNAPEFPITPDGTDIVLTWDLGANGIFKF